MREQGLAEAIRMAGGVAALARALGISQPSVSSWRRVPSERVLEIERICGVNRHFLRPDLYPEAPSGTLRTSVSAKPQGDAMADVDELDRLRAAEYGLLALLLFKAPTAEVLEQIAELTGDASPLGLTHRKLAQAARGVTVDSVGREYFHLFVGVGRSELLPYASYYLTGFLHERPLANVRAAFVELGIIRQDETREPEDHIGLLLDVMSNLAVQTIGEGYESEKAFFTTHLQPWAARFFADLEAMQKYPFYAAVGAVGRLFMEIEEEGFSFGD